MQPEGYKLVQFTLVDCPGHASLIRTIMGGAQIIDMMLLIIDITKGIQTQTAECVVIGEILAEKFLIVLNKVDLIPEEVREKTVAKAMTDLRKALGRTKLGQAEMIAVASRVGGEATVGGNQTLTSEQESIGMDLFVQKLGCDNQPHPSC